MSTASRKPHVAILIPGGLEDPSAGLCVPALAALLDRMAENFELEVFSLSGPRSNSGSRAGSKYPIHYLPEHPGLGLVRKLRGFAKAFDQRHKEKPFDLIHAFWGLPSGLAAVLIGKTKRLPSLISFQGAETAALPELNYGACLNWKTRLALRFTCAMADELTVLSAFQAQQLREVLGSKRQAQILPYGSPFDAFFQELRPLQSPYRFLHVGHQNAVKDQATLLRAFQQISSRVEARLTVVGGDFLNGANIDLVVELGLQAKVLVVGHVPHQELPAYFQSADILIHSSRYEAQGVVFCEAAAAGLLICATRVGLAADWEDFAAACAPVGDPEHLSHTVLDVLAQPEVCQRLRQAAQDWARSHDGAWTAQQFSELYLQLLGGSF